MPRLKSKNSGLKPMAAVGKANSVLELGFIPSPQAMRIGKIVAATTRLRSHLSASARLPEISVGIRRVSGEGHSFQTQSNRAIGGEGAMAISYCAPFCPNRSVSAPIDTWRVG